MTFKSFIMVLATLLLTLGPARAGDGFVTGFEDLPLMAGLTDAPDSFFVFDTPAGRVLEGYAAGQVDSAEVRAFYTQTLPQLGWVPQGRDAYVREGERLEIEPTPSNGGVSVRFTLSPLQ